MINKQKHSEAADYDTYDVSCAVNGDIIAKEMTFPYAVARWDPRVID